MALLVGMMVVSCGNNGGKEGGKESVGEQSYMPTDVIFPNPERGFYKYSATKLGASPSVVSESLMRSYREQGVTLLFRYFYLDDFKDKALSQQALDQIDADMSVLRKTGMKCVMRYAYTDFYDGPNNYGADAPLNIILQHLEQLKPVFEKNADVIAVLQAGFIGVWGEWYYSSNNLKTPEIRAQVLDKMLEALPEKRMIQVRYNGHKKDYTNRTTALTRADAFTGTKAARIGHHNDCFLASSNDYGTYIDIEAEKAYISNDGIFVPVGGETCPPSGIDPADCKKAMDEMSYLRWSFLNDDYYHGVNDRWTTQGCMDDIRRRLGYRLVLQTGSYTNEIQPGGTMNISVKLNNVGYASMFNPRNVEFVLVNDDSKEVFVAPTGEDPRFWRPGTLTEVKLSLGVPKDMPEGSYYLHLNLPDPEPLLYDNPDFSVRLANKDVWDAETGYNNLFQLIKITTSATTAVYNGETMFKRK